MPSLSLDNQMMQYWQKLDISRKKSVLSHIKSLLQLVDATKRLTMDEFIKQYNNDIDEALEDIINGRVISQEDLEKESENW